MNKRSLRPLGGVKVQWSVRVYYTRVPSVDTWEAPPPPPRTTTIGSAASRLWPHAKLTRTLRTLRLVGRAWGKKSWKRRTPAATAGSSTAATPGDANTYDFNAWLAQEVHGDAEGDDTVAADCHARRGGADGGPAWRCRTEDDGDWEHYYDGSNRVVRFKQERSEGRACTVTAPQSYPTRRDNEEENGEQKGSAASPSRVETDLVLEEWEEEGQEEQRPLPPRQPPPLPPPPLPRNMAVLLPMNNPKRPKTTFPLTATKRQASYKLGSRRGRAAKKAAERAEQAEATKAEEAKAAEEAAEAAEAAAADAAEAARAMKARKKAALKATQAEEAAAAAWVRFHRPESQGGGGEGGGGLEGPERERKRSRE